ncbi:T9SS type A sorting domain-containing protein [Chryseobacterium sp.]|uniref:T9SS type A sorting domain-containing protein n=1 Tax=Chryseobacterium sp. TaxID=1871047 RepID=UPI00289FF23A|nr:T9SS type A sorting domain-containing protein [Chryseobacterium sp.]
MKKISLLALVIGSSAFAQTITFNGCHNLFDNQNFTFTKTGVDSFNKNIYITTPVTGDQDCGGLGTCEFKIQWNNTLTRWEFLADSGSGNFVNPYLIYYNSTGNNNAANPPASNFGTWVENTSVTTGDCGGNLSSSNSTMTGDVHSSFLATAESLKNSKIQLFPNPVTDVIRISGLSKAESIEIYNSAGQMIKKEAFNERINVSTLTSGSYILRVKSADGKNYEFKFIKK